MIIDEKIIEEENIINFNYFKLGVQQASYLAGFASTLKTSLDLPTEVLSGIITNKMILEYQQEMKRMELETQERLAEKYSDMEIKYAED